jgi:hypothetical protein
MAAAAGASDTVRLLMQNGPIEIKIETDGSAALIRAAEAGHIGIVEQLTLRNSSNTVAPSESYIPVQLKGLHGPALVSNVVSHLVEIAVSDKL